jgi:hypothetical protein
MLTKERLALALALAGALLVVAGCGDDSLNNQVRPQPSSYKHENGTAPRNMTNAKGDGTTSK